MYSRFSPPTLMLRRPLLRPGAEPQPAEPLLPELDDELLEDELLDEELELELLEEDELPPTVTLKLCVLCAPQLLV